MSDKYGTNSQGQVKNFTMSIIVFFLLLILANQAATQYVAKVFAYHPNLGEPIYGSNRHMRCIETYMFSA